VKGKMERKKVYRRFKKYPMVLPEKENALVFKKHSKKCIFFVFLMDWLVKYDMIST